MKGFLTGLSLCLLVTPGFSGDPAIVTMKGRYVWVNARRPGKLSAEFVPLSQGQWKVAFRFDWKKIEHVYEGKAEGDLVNGKLEGWVLGDNKRTTYRFKGVTKDGKFTGIHLRVQIEKGGKERLVDTGTLEMTRL